MSIFFDILFFIGKSGIEVFNSLLLLRQWIEIGVFKIVFSIDYKIVKEIRIKKVATGSPGSFYIRSQKRGFSFFIDNIYNRKNTLYRVISEPSGIESKKEKGVRIYLTPCYI